MRRQQTMLWTGISFVTGVVCLGVGEPQPSMGGQVVSSAEASRGLDGAPMALIPAGPFTMGSHDGLPNERPEHTVTLDAYYIDRYEVTLSLYRKFLEFDTGYIEGTARSRDIAVCLMTHDRKFTAC